MGVKNYDPAANVLVFAGIPISGFADGTYVSVEQNEDSYALTVGADGEGCRSKTNNRSARVTVTLMQSSLSNDLLSALHNVDLASPAGDGIGPFLMKDLTGTTVMAAEKAWLVRFPTSSYARDPETREWIIETDHMIQNVGGNL
jgi:hypothetical protein